MQMFDLQFLIMFEQVTTMQGKYKENQNENKKIDKKTTKQNDKNNKVIEL